MAIPNLLDCRRDPDSPAEQDRRNQGTVLRVLIDEHPVRMSLDELILVMQADPEGDDPGIATRDALRELVSRRPRPPTRSLPLADASRPLLRGRGRRLMARAEECREIGIRFGRSVFLARRRADLFQEELSIRAAVHRTEVGLVENGARVPRLDTILKLAGGIDADPCVLLDGLAWVPHGFRQGRFYVVGEAASRRLPAG